MHHTFSDFLTLSTSIALRKWSDFLFHRGKKNQSHQIKALSTFCHQTSKIHHLYSFLLPFLLFQRKRCSSGQATQFMGAQCKVEMRHPLFRKHGKLQDSTRRARRPGQIPSEPRALGNRTRPHLWGWLWCRLDFPGLFLPGRGSYPFLPHQEAVSNDHPCLPFSWLLISSSHYQPHTNNALLSTTILPHTVSSYML